MKLEELKKLCDEATIGPWTWRSEGLVNKYIDEGLVIPKADAWGDRWVEPKDKAFIAAARTYLPRLIAVAEAATNLKRNAPMGVPELIAALAALEAP
jgi:hypothetical protein